MKYILELEGDFEKGECEKCPICINPNEYVGCRLPFKECPLEEVEQGEWIIETRYTYLPIEYDAEGMFVSHPYTVYICSKCGRVERNAEPYCHCGAERKVQTDVRRF